jgi:hypothetical protein
MENVSTNQSKKSFFKSVLTKLKQFKKFVVEECIKFPLYILAQPLKGFEEFKRYKRGRMSVALSFMIITVLVNILKFQYDGFLVNKNSIKDMNSIAQIAYVVGAVLVVTVANWSVTTLFDGKGTMKDIFMMICYCLYPFMWANAFGILLSNVLTQDEMAIYTLVIGLGVALLLYMFFFGIISIHEYGLGKCVLTILFTLIAALIVLFAGLLFFDLFQRMYGFVYTIYREISLRELLW